VNIYEVSSLATIAIHIEMNVISHCNTHIFSHNYDNYNLCTKLYLVKNSFLAHFVSRTILAAIDHMQEHIFPDFALTTLKFAEISRLSRRVAALNITYHRHPSSVRRRQLSSTSADQCLPLDYWPLQHDKGRWFQPAIHFQSNNRVFSQRHLLEKLVNFIYKNSQLQRILR